MDMQKVLVTGASRGIGRAIALWLAENGYLVMGTSRSPEAIEENKRNLSYVRLDITDDGSITDCLNKCGDIDILINNAGQSLIGPVEDTPLSACRAVFDVNLFGLIELTRKILPGMRHRRYGYIVNIGSMAGRFAIPFQSVYSATKFAIEGFSWSLRNEVMKYGIRVVVIEPNDIRTSIEPSVYVRAASDYSADIRKVKKMREENMKNAPGPEVVARRVYQILQKKNPRPFYAVGRFGPALVFLKRFISDRAVERMLKSRYGIT